MQIGNQAICPAQYVANWPIILTRRGRIEKRRDLGLVWALPLRHLQIVWRRIKIQRIALVFVSEQGYLRGGLKRRILRKHLRFLGTKP